MADLPDLSFATLDRRPPDAQVLVIHDVVGLYGEFKPRFVRRYLEAGRLIQEALSRYVAEVREGVFPGEEHSF